MIFIVCGFERCKPLRLHPTHRTLRKLNYMHTLSNHLQATIGTAAMSVRTTHKHTTCTSYSANAGCISSGDASSRRPTKILTTRCSAGGALARRGFVMLKYGLYIIISVQQLMRYNLLTVCKTFYPCIYKEKKANFINFTQ